MRIVRTVVLLGLVAAATSWLGIPRGGTAGMYLDGDARAGRATRHVRE